MAAAFPNGSRPLAPFALVLASALAGLAAANRADAAPPGSTPAAAASAQAPAVRVLTVRAPATPEIRSGLDAWCAEAVRATEGRVRCRVEPAPAAAAVASDLVAGPGGRSDLAVVDLSDEPARYPVGRIAELPFLGDFAETVSVVYQRLFDRTPAMQAEHRGAKVLAVFVSSPAQLYTGAAGIDDLAPLRAGAGVCGNGFTAVAAHWRLPSSTVCEPGRAIAEVADAAAFDRSSVARSFGSAVVFPGGIFSSTHAFTVDAGVWSALGGADRTALQAISGERAAATFGRLIDATEWKTNLRQRNAGLVFRAPGEVLLAQVQAGARQADAAWIRVAARAGVPQPARVLANFRKAVQDRELAD